MKLAWRLRKRAGVAASLRRLDEEFLVMMMKKLGLAAAAVLLSASAAFAVPFGPATASLGSFDVPTVTLGTTSGSIMLNGGTAALNAGTGSLSATPYYGSGTGLLNFSFTPGVVVADSIPNLFGFGDNAGGGYVFNLISIDTISYTNTPGVSTSIALYLLGTMGDAHLGLDPTPTSLTMTFNRTGASNFSESGSLSNPPVPVPVTPVPEPASLTLLGLGLAGLGAIRRRAKR